MTQSYDPRIEALYVAANIFLSGVEREKHGNIYGLLEAMDLGDLEVFNKIYGIQVHAKLNWSPSQREVADLIRDTAEDILDLLERIGKA